MKQYITYYNCATNPNVGQFCLYYKNELHHTLSGAISFKELKATYPKTPIILINEVHPKHFGTDQATLLANGGILS